MIIIVPKALHLRKFLVQCSKQTVFLPVPSDPVSDLEVIERTTDSLTLSWTNPHFTGFAPITSFRVRITGGETERSEAFDGDETLTEHTVSSLSPLSLLTVSPMKLSKKNSKQPSHP